MRLAGQAELPAGSRAVLETLKQFLNILLHLQDHLFALTKDYGSWVYAMLFAIIFAETGLVITPVLPGDSLVFAVGAVAANPESGLNIWVAGFLMLLAAILGDTVNYWVGAKLGTRVQGWFPRLVRQSHIDRTHAFYEKYGGKTIILPVRSHRSDFRPVRRGHGCHELRPLHDLQCRRSRALDRLDPALRLVLRRTRIRPPPIRGDRAGDHLHQRGPHARGMVADPTPEGLKPAAQNFTWLR